MPQLRRYNICMKILSQFFGPSLGDDKEDNFYQLIVCVLEALHVKFD